MATWVVTGASRGLGLEMVRQLAQRGERVIAAARDPGGAKGLAALDVRALPLDVADAASVAAFAKALGGEPVDVLVNNAGIGVKPVAFAELDLDTLARFFAVNSTGPIRVAQALLANLRAGKRKVLANITSKMGSIADNASGGAYAYRASKAALNMLNKCIAVDLRADGIIPVVIHPGWVKTDMGGPRAPLEAPESVAGMLRVIDGLRPEDAGRFLNYDGTEIPW